MQNALERLTANHSTFEKSTSDTYSALNLYIENGIKNKVMSATKQ